MPESLFYHPIYIVLLAGILAKVVFSKHYKNEALMVLEAMNILMAIGGIVFLAFQGIEFLKEPTNEMERSALINRWTGPYSLFVWWGTLSRMLLPQLFWKKNLRQSILLSLLLWAVQTVSGERLLIWLLSWHRDYLPSSWAMHTVHDTSEQLLAVGLYLGMVGFLYTFFRKRQHLRLS